MKYGLALGITIALAATFACGGDTATPSSPSQLPSAAPASPAPAPGPSPAPGGGATISGTIQLSAGASAFMGVTTAVVVQVLGTDITATVGSGGAFALNGVPAGNVALRITGSGKDGTVELGPVQTGQAVRVVIVFAGSTPVVSADSRVSEGQKRELEGQIQTLLPPDRFVLNSQVVEVVPGTTVIRQDSRSMSYADLTVGYRVHVRGTSRVTSGGTVITAEWIELQNNNQPGPAETKEIEGRVDTPFPVSGSCGSFPLVFTVSGTAVRAVASTSFVPGCQFLAAGKDVEVKGVLQADGSLAATLVKLDNASSQVELEGRVLAVVGGTCGGKDLAFSARDKSGSTQIVRTDAATKFDDACSAIVVGAKVEAKGTLLPDGSILARKVEVDEGNAP